jgi:hypothetical protein
LVWRVGMSIACYRCDSKANVLLDTAVMSNVSDTPFGGCGKMPVILRGSK